MWLARGICWAASTDSEIADVEMGLVDAVAGEAQTNGINSEVQGTVFDGGYI